MQAVKRMGAVHFFKDIQEARDRLVVGGVQAERPAVGGQQRDHVLKVRLKSRRQVGPGLEEVLEVRRAEHEHLPRPVEPEHVVALPRLRHADPAREVLLFLLRLLREEIVGDAQGQLAALVQLVDDHVIVRVILEAAAGIDDARQAEPVQLAHELARRVVLVLDGQLRALGERGVEDGGVRPRDQQAGRVAELVALDLAAGRIRRVLVVANRPQRRAVQHGLAIEVQDKHGRVGRRLVQFLERGQALLGELELAPAAHHAHPLRRRRARRLLLQHAQPVGQRRHAVPPELEVVVQPAANDVQVRVVEPGNHRAAAEVDHLRARPGQRQNVAVGADREKPAVADGHGLGKGALLVLRGDAAVMEDQLGGGGGVHGGNILGGGAERDAGGQRGGPQQEGAAVEPGRQGRIGRVRFTRHGGARAGKRA